MILNLYAKGTSFSLCMFILLINTNVLGQTSFPGSGVSDIDGNQYGSIVLGNGQEWMTENLRTTRFNDGTSIQELTVGSDWINTISPAMCLFDNNSVNDEAFGKIYNGYVVADSRQVCPEGWRVATDSDWKKLIIYLDSNADTICYQCEQSSLAGGMLKETGSLYWNSPNTGATNAIDFNARGAGSRQGDSDGAFLSQRIGAGFWTSTDTLVEGLNNPDHLFLRSLRNISGSIVRNSTIKTVGFGIRCMRSETVTSATTFDAVQLDIYPNPSKGKYYINAKGNVRVFDVTGKEVYQTSSFNAPTEVDLSALPSGIYTIQLTNKGGVFTGKVVRE